jgi:hypothetical protein
MMTTAPPAPEPEPEGTPATLTEQLVEAHGHATASLAEAAATVTKAHPGEFPALEQALEAIAQTATALFVVRLLGMGHAVTEKTTARKSREVAPARPPVSDYPTGAYL